MVFCPPIIQPFQFNAAIWSLTSHVGFVSGGVFFARKADRERRTCTKDFDCGTPGVQLQRETVTSEVFIELNFWVKFSTPFEREI